MDNACLTFRRGHHTSAGGSCRQPCRSVDQSIADDDPDPYRARNRIQVRQWTAARYKPEAYGDRLDVSVTQTVSIQAALTDARTRLRFRCDPPAHEFSQPIEQATGIGGGVFDLQSNTPPKRETDLDYALDEDDILA